MSIEYEIHLLNELIRSNPDATVRNFNDLIERILIIEANAKTRQG